MSFSPSALSEMVSRAKAKVIKVYLTKQHGELKDCAIYPLTQKRWFSDEIDAVAYAEQVEVLDLYSSWITFCLESSYQIAKKYYTAEGLYTNLSGANKMAEMVAGCFGRLTFQRESSGPE